MSSDLERFLAQARGSVGTAAAKLVHVDHLIQAESRAAWELNNLRGRLVELSARGANATLTCAIDLVLEAQHASEPVAWIMLASGSFYPPDVADSGVDLAALVVIRVPDAIAAARAAERVLRSGAFGLVVLDIHDSAQAQDISMAHQGRLVTLAQSHDAAVVCITDKTADTASLGSLVSLRVEALRVRTANDFELTVRALKDKRRGPGWSKKLKARGPAGF